MLRNVAQVVIAAAIVASQSPRERTKVEKYLPPLIIAVVFVLPVVAALAAIGLALLGLVG